MHGLRPGLDDEKLSGQAVLGPFDVHGLVGTGLGRIVGLDGHRHAGQVQDFRVGHHQSAPVGQGHVHVLGGGFGIVGVDHLDGLFPGLFHDDGLETKGQGGLEHVVLVRAHRALHHVFSQAPGPGDVHGVLEPGLGVYGEHHSRAGQVRAHHLLHADGQGDGEVVEALVHPVGDGPIGEERCEAALAGLHELFRSVDVQVGFLLARERRVGQVLGRGRGAHGHVAVRAVFFLQPLVGVFDGLAQVLGEGQGADEGANLAAALGQILHVMGVQVRQDVLDLLGCVVMGEQMAIGRGSDGKAVWNAHPLLAEFAVHLSQGGVFPANQGHVLDGELVEPEDETVASFHGASFCGPGRIEVLGKRGVGRQQTLRGDMKKIWYAQSLVKILPKVFF